MKDHPYAPNVKTVESTPDATKATPSKDGISLDNTITSVTVKPDGSVSGSKAIVGPFSSGAPTPISGSLSAAQVKSLQADVKAAKLDGMPDALPVANPGILGRQQFALTTSPDGTVSLVTAESGLPKITTPAGGKTITGSLDNFTGYPGFKKLLDAMAKVPSDSGVTTAAADKSDDKDGIAPPTKDGSNFAADAIKAAAAAAAKDGLTVEGGSGVDPRIVARGQDSGPRTGMGQILDKKMDDAKSGDTAKPEDR